MKYYRCKCGVSEAWTSMGVDRCSRCSACGSDLAQGPSEHREPEPHEYVNRFDENTGRFLYEICRRCGERKP